MYYNLEENCSTSRVAAANRVKFMPTLEHVSRQEIVPVMLLCARKIPIATPGYQDYINRYSAISKTGEHQYQNDKNSLPGVDKSLMSDRVS